jgi:Tol biopolymer transport system component
MKIAIAGFTILALTAVAGAFQTGSLLRWLPLVASVATVSDQNPSDVILRRLLTTDSSTADWTPSPDGRTIAIVDWVAGGNVAIRDLATGEIRQVTTTGGFGVEGGGFAIRPQLSRDGRRVFYNWCCTPEGRAPGQSQTATADLRAINVDGTGETVIFVEDEVWPETVAWTPDGSGVLALLFYPDAPYMRVSEISLSTGAVRDLWTANDRKPVQAAAYSPDGRYIAFSRTTYSASPLGSDVFIRAADGTSEALIAGGPGHDQLLGWSGDGRHVYFLSDRSGSPAVWSVPVREGGATNAPLLVRNDVAGARPIGGGGGRLFYAVELETQGLRTMAVDVENGRLLAPPVPEEGLGTGVTTAPDWSPDGRYLAYVYRSVPMGAALSSLVIRPTDGGDLRQLPLPESLSEYYWLRWAPDGRSILVCGDGATAGGLIRVTLDTGAISEPVTPCDRRGALSPDHRLGYGYGPGGMGRLDLQTKKFVAYYEPSERAGASQGVIEVSPDGQTLAIGGSDGIALMPAGGGAFTSWIFRGTNFVDYGHRTGHPFTPDGRYLIVRRRPLQPGEEPGALMGARDVPDELWAYPLDGSAPHKICTVPTPIRNQLRLSPDGQHLAFVGGETRSELWVIEPAVR